MLLNKKQRNILIAGVTLVALILIFQPIRKSNPFHDTAKANIAKLIGKEYQSLSHVQDRNSNRIAACVVVIATVIGFAFFRSPSD